LVGAYPNVDTFIEFMKAATGWDLTVEEILKTGERIYNLRQSFNVREGLNSLQFEVPARMAGIPPKTSGPLKGITLDEAAMDREYVTELDWDAKTARPNKKKLAELGLDDVAKVLWP
jgi:aldehyde:ferredoxin oxidoreductase